MKKNEARHRRIRAEMVGRGIVGAEIARKLGVNRSLVTNVVAGRLVSHRVQEALIEAGVPAKLFPPRKKRRPVAKEEE